MAKSVTLSAEQVQALRDFITAFELVFDLDWQFTAAALNAEPDENYIAEGGTFLNPGVPDPSNNNANRGNLLSSYEHLKEVIDEALGD